MHSPAEAFGLWGKTLDGRVRNALRHVPDPTLRRMADRLKADALANEVTYEHDGTAEPIRIMLRPLLAMPEQLSYVEHVCMKIQEALMRLPEMYLQDDNIRRILAISPAEDDWLRENWSLCHRHLNPVYGRLDAVCDFANGAWQDSLKFLEPNLSGVGGIHYAPLAEQLVMRDVVPTLVDLDPELSIELPRDQRDLFLQVLMDHARAIGREACRFCFVEPKYVHEGPNEQATLLQYLAQKHGLTIVHADPTELRVEGEEVWYQDVCVDVVYRDYETRDLVALEKQAGLRLDAMRLLFRQNRLVSSVAGDFDHKSCWELLTDESIAERYFTVEERRLFRRHVLWTRIVDQRNTTLPHGEIGSLSEYIRQHREQMVLKPNRGYGGQGVALGANTSQSDWEKLLREAISLAKDPARSWVVQEATQLPVLEFPVIDADGRVFEEPFYSVMGFAPTDNGLGILCRVSQKQVVNVAQRGGLAAVLIAHPPRDLRMPRRITCRAEVAADTLQARIAELRALDHTIGLLGWDEETMLSAAGRSERGEQLAALEGMRHKLLMSDELSDLAEEVSQLENRDARWDRELVLLRRTCRLATALPETLVKEFAKAKSHAIGAWEEARVNDDFAAFAKPLEKIVSLVRERAQTLTRDSDPYNAILEDFEPGMNRSRLDQVFAELQTHLVPMVQHFGSAPPPDTLSGRRFDDEGQMTLCRSILDKIGFDFKRGRLDLSTHPFTLQAGSHDVRLTIRVDDQRPVSTVLTTLHEGGHGLFDQGFLPSDCGTLVGESPSMGLHESQARFWENHVGRSPAFWHHWYPVLNRIFPQAMSGLDADTFVRIAKQVSPTTNRVSADEISYHLHIIMRYELEQALLFGDLSVCDLPVVWNERSTALLGVTPTSNLDGVLQDVHWSLGLFGYFPTYTLGSLYAAQFAETYERENPLQEEIGQGNFAPVLSWLRRHVHQIGHRMSAEEVITQATGSGLDLQPFLRHLKRNYP
jgi:carboxypeptidase Taq